MRVFSLLFTASLALNAAIVSLIVVRGSDAPDTFARVFRFGSSSADTAAARSQFTLPPPTGARALWPLLASEDPATLIARLRAAGFPAAIIREIVRARIDAHYAPRLAAYTESDPNTPYWKSPPLSLRFGAGKWEEYSQLQRERSKVLRDLFADPFFAGDKSDTGQRVRFGNLSRQKIDVVQRIEDDYAQMMSAIRASTNGILLAADREKLAYLAREKQNDLAGVLDAAELRDYEMRSSPITAIMRDELGRFRATEAEFRALFEAQKTLNDKFPYSPGTMGSYQERGALMHDLAAQLRERMGEVRYREYVRETDSDFRHLRALAQRENLPPGADVHAFDLRYNVSNESMRILKDSSLRPEEKRAAITQLGQDTKSQILSVLGPTAGSTYLKVVDAQWLQFLQQGNAVTFDGGPRNSFGRDNVMVWFGTSFKIHSVPSVSPGPRRPEPRP